MINQPMIIKDSFKFQKSAKIKAKKTVENYIPHKIADLNDQGSVDTYNSG